MKRTAYISPATLGCIDAYEMVITDISKALEVENTSIKSLFFGGMILSGIEKIVVTKNTMEKLPREMIDYASPIGKSSIEEIYTEVDDFLWANALVKKDSKKAYVIGHVSAYLSDVLSAADCNRPLLTTFAIPSKSEYSKYVKREAIDIIDFLVKSVTTIQTSSPFLKSEITKADLNKIKTILSSDLFRTYSDSLVTVENERLSKESLRSVDGKVLELVKTFDNLLGIRKVTSSFFGLIPDIVELQFGKISGKLSRVVIDPMNKIIEGQRVVQIHSFHPVWREIWEERLRIVSSLLPNDRRLGLTE